MRQGILSALTPMATSIAQVIARDLPVGPSWLLPTGADGALETWSNKPISQQLAAHWDTLQGGRKLFQTVLLRKAA